MGKNLETGRRGLIEAVSLVFSWRVFNQRIGLRYRESNYGINVRDELRRLGKEMVRYTCAHTI
jgi:hypothetical protein